jgi:hypothetical protein
MQDRWVELRTWLERVSEVLGEWEAVRDEAHEVLG